MKRVTQIATTCLLAALVLFVTHVRAQETNVSDRTFMTFSSAVELPGVTLEPGTYEFRLADSPARNVVQVLRKDNREPIGQWTFVPADRPKISDETVVMFRESKEGSTPAVQYWYFPNEKIGKEFVYPKDQAERIATRTGQTVQGPDGAVTSATASASATRDEAAASEQAAADSVLRNAPAASQPTAAAGSTTGNRGVSAESQERPRNESRPAPAESVEARAESAAPAAPAPRPVGTSGSASADQQRAGAAGAQPTESRELPETASPLALTGLIGLLSMAGAFGLRALRG